MFVERPIGARFIAASEPVIAAQPFFWLRATRVRCRERVLGVALPAITATAGE